MYWIKDKPKKAGKYWIREDGLSRVVNIWKYKGENTLFTNEDGGMRLDVYERDNVLWGDKPIPEPSFKENNIDSMVSKIKDVPAKESDAERKKKLLAQAGKLKSL